jgi:hypothetical protein
VVISLPSPGLDSSSISVAGHREDVDRIIPELSKFVKISKTIPVPRAYRSVLLSELSDRLATLEICGREEHSTGIVLYGCEQAIEMINDDIDVSLKQMQNERPTEFITVPSHQHGLLVGRGGKTIENLRLQSNCHIYVPPPSAAVDVIELTGSAESIAKAKSLVEALLNKAK